MRTFMPIGGHVTNVVLLLAITFSDTSAAEQQQTGNGADRGSAAAVEFFERRVRPILASHCEACHGSKKQESGLRLDSRDAVLTGGDSGPAAVSQAPGKSLILQAIRHDGDLAMPPETKLAPQQIDAITKWIQLGLPWPASDSPTDDDGKAEAAMSHWAFQPVSVPQIPVVKNKSWPQSSLDNFVLAELEAANLSPASQAAAHTLIRRATLDLLGLPPTPEEVLQFEAAWQRDSRAAWSSLIDRLLESPHYGERQARFWLDVARYADNKGYVFFESKNYPWAWTYRDWVIQAFNDDLPYDQFVVKQLAADLLDDEAPGSLAAMGFLTLGPRFMNNTHDVIDDRIDVVTRGLLGLTVTCARCHEHKFDPVPQEDYYSLYGIFRSSIEPTLRPLFQPTPDTDEYRSFDKGMRERVEKLETFIETQRQQMMKGSRDRAAEYLLAVHRKRDQPTTENFMLLTEKGSLIPAMVHRWEVYLKRTRREGNPVWTVWHRLSDLPDDEFSARAQEVHDELFSRGASANAAAPLESEPARINRLILDAFASEVPTSMEAVAKTYGELFAQVDQDWQKQLEQKGTAATALDDHTAEEVRQVLYGAGSPPMVPRALGWGFLDLLPDRPTQGEFKKLLGEVEKHSTSAPGAPPRAMVLVDSETPYQPVVFRRGNPNREGDAVPRRFLDVLSRGQRPEFQQGSGRLQLARAITDPSNPLTARVFVNRIWQQHFGTGLVETASDFGLQSNPPSHPELLDSLAKEFVTNGWSVKKLHHAIMTSSAFQQASTVDRSVHERAMTADSANRLLWRFPRRRLDFESMRDTHLAVSGSLDNKRGGPPVNILGGYNGRRSIYGFINRMDLPGLMRTFDFPEPAATSAGREVTTVPQQALFFLNHDFVAETARRLLRRTDVSSQSNPAARLDHIHRILLGRSPTDVEKRLATAFLDRPAEERPASTWKYGYGGIDEKTQQVSQFAELTHWTGSRWQAGAQLPDPNLGWVFHDRTGGHPASSDDRCFILRWTAPVTSVFSVTGKFAHRPEPGNGVRGRIVSSQSGILGEWKVDQSETETTVDRISVEAGQTIDFVVDWQGHITHDEFEWPVVVRQISDNSETGSQQQWDSQKEFAGAASDPWVDYVHALLITNEFAFVD